MSKTTDGPWFLDQYGHVYGWKPTENGKTSVLLIDNRHSAATSADKNLISAAPELLKALRALVDLQEANEASETKALDFWDHARAAIAKATGEAA
jgi:hypothetical protein